jgi:hypothetical protein
MAPETLHESILEFLNSASSPKKTVATCDCGAAMEYQKITFFYDGKSWEVVLLVCFRCHPVSPVTTKCA